MKISSGRGRQRWAELSAERGQCLALAHWIDHGSVVATRTQYVDKKSFVGGNAAGDLLVFDLDTGAFAGGLPFAAVSSSSTKAKSDEDLRSNFYDAIRSSLRRALPDAKGL